ncbi:ABC-type sugar transport system ATPase subunit [Nakamurella flavida]|uniref:sugar ABC transporter ATP-binding protein n=1 Tax=Nakamurella flavida TaxID=363630 RepID=UPI002784BD52|nr:sugar ABC transporter ATP-binding protein [Nakamurella flavida]MDP9778528.1 ABC-type sugar transport system ATPase subunit [Nakamurella flavida]
MSTTILQARGVSKRFGATQALDDVSLTLVAGERVAVMGENGAGKSTLMKVFAGVHTPDAGSMDLHGTPFAPRTPTEAILRGISTVYQEPAGFPHLSVLENLSMGRQQHTAGWLQNGRMRDEGVRLLDRIGLPARTLRRSMGELSLAEQQLVLIARAVAADPKVLILDEPTSILTDTESQRLFGLVDELVAGGVGVCFITHRFDELDRMADRFLVLRDGRLVGETTNPDRDGLLAMMGGRDLGGAPRRAAPAPAPAPTGDAPRVRSGPAIGETVLRLDGWTLAGTFEDVSLDVQAGRITGLYGLVGAGRTEIALSVLGELGHDAGTLEYLGAPMRPSGSRAALAKGIAYLPEDRKTQGILRHMTVAENVSIAALPSVTDRGVVNRRRERDLVGSWIQRIRIKTAGPAAPITSLSGGNQQKALLARLLAIDPHLLVLDEPTRGIDVATKAEIHRDIKALAAQGVAVLLISSEMSELLELADVVHTLHEGRITSVLHGTEITEQAVLRGATGVLAAASVSAVTPADTPAAAATQAAPNDPEEAR